MPDDRIFINGIDGLTGEYLVHPRSPSEVATQAKLTPQDPSLARWLKVAWENISSSHFGLPFNVDPENVAEAGWGIVFPAGAGDAIQEALEPLVEHRRQQAGSR